MLFDKGPTKRNGRGRTNEMDRDRPTDRNGRGQGLTIYDTDYMMQIIFGPF